jgi:C4-dicarboxylate-specific signal transduction histidine kinase
VEYRLRGSDGSNRWFLVRGNPVRDQAGKIVRRIGTCTDIEEQRHHQQILERQIKERTEELAEANTRLQEETWEKNLGSLQAR